MKTHKVYLMPDAIKDLEQIYEYISAQSGFPERAWAYIEKLKFQCQTLETNPLRRQQRNDLMNDLRIYPLNKKTLWRQISVGFKKSLILKGFSPLIYYPDCT